MATKSTNSTIFVVAFVAIVGFLAYKLWPALAKKLKGSSGGAAGAGGAGGAAGGSYYAPYQGPNPSNNSGMSAGLQFGGGGNNPGGKAASIYNPDAAGSPLPASAYMGINSPSMRVPALSGTGTETMAQYAKDYNALMNQPAPAGSSDFAGTPDISGSSPSSLADAINSLFGDSVQPNVVGPFSSSDYETNPDLAGINPAPYESSDFADTPDISGDSSNWLNDAINSIFGIEAPSSDEGSGTAIGSSTLSAASVANFNEAIQSDDMSSGLGFSGSNYDTNPDLAGTVSDSYESADFGDGIDIGGGDAGPGITEY
jgi:hypothetical protein